MATDYREKLAEFTASQIKLMRTQVEDLTGGKPRPISQYPSYDQVMAILEKRKKDFAPMSDNRVQIGKRLMGLPKFHSIRPLSHLRPVYLETMMVEKRYKTQYLLCRVISKIVYIPGIIFFVIMDTRGYCAVMEIYDYPILPVATRLATPEDAASIFQEETILAIKEPRFSETFPGDEVTLLVYSASDIEILKPDNPVVRDIEWIDRRRFVEIKDDEPKKDLMEWKEIGNEFYGKRDYLRALDAYSSGINDHPDDPNLHLLYLNRSAVQLAIERLPAALNDVDEALRLITVGIQIAKSRSEEWASLLIWDEKARIRRSKCLYRLRQWTKSLKAYEDASRRFPKSSDAKEGIALCQARLREQDTGKYDLFALFKQVEEKGQNRLHAADYLGPVGTLHFPKMGRGLITTRDVKAGELLLASKALVAVFPQDWKDKGQAQPVSIDVLNMTDNSSSASLLSSELAYRLTHQPEVHSIIDRLDKGPGLKPPPIIPVQDICKMEGTERKPVDPQAIDRLVTYTARTFHSVYYNGGDEDPRGPKEIGQPSGLFPYSSFINHACIGNAACTYIGDMQFVRATEDLPKGTQILVQDIPDEDEKLRSRALKERFGPHFRCHCDLCEDDRMEPKGTDLNRAGLWHQFQQQFPGGEWPPAPASETRARQQILADQTSLAMIEATYHPKRITRLRFHTVMVNLTLGHTWLALMDHTPVVKSKQVLMHYKNCLRDLGVLLREDQITKSNTQSKPNGPIADVPENCPILSLPQMNHDLAVMIMGRIAKESEVDSGPKEAKRWVQAMKWADSLVIGPSVALFTERNKPTFESHHLYKYI